MNQKNSFIDHGQTEAVKGIREKAKKEIVAIESSDAPKEEKVHKIKKIEESRDGEIRQLKSAHILWSSG